ncbi:hypothetical protein SAMN05660443_1592 [Marinospirillum celere]|uniref:Uncharacterized protein n=1 Tax=Marinospirillum celere TaxID=1122252 RepID=A0A1I1GRW3_9GAMM|nr:hypothetical protein SAMN05660443_1592 [Marinospirillum celere]
MNNCNELMDALKSLREKKIREYLISNNRSRDSALAFHELYNKNYRAARRLFKLEFKKNNKNPRLARLIDMISEVK